MTQQVTPALVNGDHTANIYITQDPAVNALTLTLTNGLDTTVVFPPGTPVADDELPPGQSAIYFYFNGIIDNADVAAFKPTAADWTAATFPDARGYQYLVIAPGSQVLLAPGETLTFHISNVLVTGQPSSGYADINLAGAGGVSDDEADLQLFLNVANPPHPGLNDLHLTIGFIQRAIYAGKDQQLTLFLSNPGSGPLVPGGTDAWKGVTPTFQLTLAYGDGPGALTTLADAANIAMSIKDDYGNHWLSPAKPPEAPAPYWIMQPNRNGGGTVLGTGEQATIEFALTGIDDSLPAGLDDALTPAYVSWSNVPGYKDDFTTVLITKLPGPQVESFYTTPAAVPYGASSVQAMLHWNTVHSTGVKFVAPGVPSDAPFNSSGDGPIPGGVTVQRGTNLTLIAYREISETKRRARRPLDDKIYATAELTMKAVLRSDTQASFGNLGGIVLPKASRKAFLFQINIGNRLQQPLTRGAVLDLSTTKVTSTFDLAPLIPGSSQLIQAAVPSPDGKTIHVLCSTAGATDFYLVALDVATASPGTPVHLGALTPSGQASTPTLLATQDGTTVFASAWKDFPTAAQLCVSAVDAASYTKEGSWTTMVDATMGMGNPVAVNADGGMMLVATWGGLILIDVANGFTTKTTLNIYQQLKLLLVNQAVSSDFTRLYGYITDGIKAPWNGSLIVVDIDPITGSLTLAKDAPLGVAHEVGCPMVLSPDEATIYMALEPGNLNAFDTTTLASTSYGCGSDFTPLLVVPGPDAFYCTGTNNISTNTITTVSLG